METLFEIRTERTKIKKSLQDKKIEWLLKYLNADSPASARKIIIERKRSAFIKAKQKSGDAICWNCVHATSKYDECSWSRDLTPRDDWKEDCITCENEDDLSVVCNCPGFILNEEDSLCRQAVESIIGDFFNSYSDLLSKEYFATTDSDGLLSWVKLYNRLTQVVGVAELKLYKKTKEDEEYEDIEY